MAQCKCESVANYHKSHLKLLVEPQRAVKPSVPVVWNEICFPLEPALLKKAQFTHRNAAAFILSAKETLLGRVAHTSVFTRISEDSSPGEHS